MSAIPSKTGVPDIVNSKLTNTVDFHIASTNFNSILKSYINFLALSKYYDSLKYESDPITAEATFWDQLANAYINLQTFAKNPKATKYLTRLEIELNDNEFLKVNESGDPLIYISAKGNLIAETTEVVVLLPRVITSPTATSVVNNVLLPNNPVLAEPPEEIVRPDTPL